MNKLHSASILLFQSSRLTSSQRVLKAINDSAQETDRHSAIEVLVLRRDHAFSLALRVALIKLIAARGHLSRRLMLALTPRTVLRCLVKLQSRAVVGLRNYRNVDLGLLPSP